MILKLQLVAMCILISTNSFSWFEPNINNTFVSITRVNHYSTSSNSLAIWNYTHYYDYGDPFYMPDSITGDIVPEPFACGYPITFDIWMTQHNQEVARYQEATLEYFKLGSGMMSTGVYLDWYNISTITNFVTVEGIEGSHFGIITWMPPDTNNVFYLVRIWACLENGMQSANKQEDHITKDGNMGTWDDCSVVLIKSTPKRRPGFVYVSEAPDEILADETHIDDQIANKNIFTRFYNRLINILRR